MGNKAGNIVQQTNFKQFLFPKKDVLYYPSFKRPEELSNFREQISFVVARYLVSTLSPVFLCLSIYCQDSCLLFPAKKIDVFINPSFEASANCNSYFPVILATAAPGWYALNYLIPIAYFNSCTNFVISDSALLQAFYYYWQAIPQAQTVMVPTVFPTVPQPIPDGNGVVGITDASTLPGSFGDAEYKKNYVGTCLTQQLLKDSLYRLDFYLGFGQRSNTLVNITATCNVPPPECVAGPLLADRGISLTTEKIALFGAGECGLLASQSTNTGCLNNGGWFTLGTCLLEGSLNSWVKGSISFKAPQNNLPGHRSFLRPDIATGYQLAV